MATIEKEIISLSPRDFSSENDIRWCPGCGDYSILANMKKILPKLGLPRENIVFVSGIGCSSRFPYYINTFGMHTIHGRAPPIATGLKATRPDLLVFVVTGDGDGLSIGGNHLIHAMRRNIDINILLFNNRIYGLTKGQYSPTSKKGKRTKSTPMGSIDYPLNPISIALSAESTFIARTIDVWGSHLQEILLKAAKHKGTSFVEIYQNCVIFNDKVFDFATDKRIRQDHILELRHEKPMIFGRNKDKGIILDREKLVPKVVEIGKNGYKESDLLVHDEFNKNPTMAFFLSRMTYDRSLPEPIGVFRSIQIPTYDEMLGDQIKEAQSINTQSFLDLLHSGETWEVK